MALRLIPIHRSINRPNLFLGGDRELVMLTGVLTFALIFAALDWVATGLGVVLWTFGLWVFRKMAKADPMLRGVYFRQLRYRAYYPPRSTPWRVNHRERR